MRIFLVEIQEVCIFLFSCFSNIFHSVSLGRIPKYSLKSIGPNSEIYNLVTY